MEQNITQSRLMVSRRRALGLGGTIGLGTLLAACSTPDATTPTSTPTASDGAAISPSTTSSAELVAKFEAVGVCGLETEEVTQGPYWFDVDSIRSDIREDRPGTTLAVALRVLDASCEPVPNSVVEIWHCDAGGVYSGFEVSSTGGGGPKPGAGGDSGSGETSDGSYSEGNSEASPSDDGTYLRGAQVADANGIVQFTTIWPGWYRGRTVHIHIKVHIDKATVLTAQLGFDDDINDAVFEASPYSSHQGRDTYNRNDSIISDASIATVEQTSGSNLAYLNLML